MIYSYNCYVFMYECVVTKTLNCLIHGDAKGTRSSMSNVLLSKYTFADIYFNSLYILGFPAAYG